ncbi:MAG TPA: hypothetical protein V6D18_02060 [Thermosynechococcaceae cyanobacterium]
MSSVYLLHFSKPISPAHTTRHYLSYTKNLKKRLQQHRDGKGSRLCEVALERGIGFEVAKVWEGDRTLERQLKSQKNAPRFCPVCQQRQ